MTTQDPYIYGNNIPLPPEVKAEPKIATPPRSVVMRELIETLLLTFFIIYMVNTISGRYRVEGHSMMPTMQEGEYLIINKLSYMLAEPSRGDIIVFKYPRDPSREFIKRVIGTPGDRVEINDEVVMVNNTVLDEPYIQAHSRITGSWIVPEGSLFVMGDNRNNSSDSRSWSFLEYQFVIGRASTVYWPRDLWGAVPHYELEVNPPAGDQAEIETTTDLEVDRDALSR